MAPTVRDLLALVVVAAAVAGGCRAHDLAASAAGSPALPPGDHDLALTVDGRPRTYVLRLPQAAHGEPRPVILTFHGGGGTGAGFKRYAGLDAVAEREGVIVAYLDGSGPLGRRLLTWNAGDCCGYAHEEAVDDVGFALAVLRDVARRAPMDATRVYATGHSNGAMMAYRLALEAPERIAAIATVGGMMAVEQRTPARPVALLHVHSVDDPRALYDGGLGPPFPFTGVKVRHTAVEPTLARWARESGCPTQPKLADRRTTSSRPGQTAQLLVWGPCASGAEVHLWKLEGVGHGWPGDPSPMPEWWMGPYTDVIDAAAEAWRFLRRFRHPDAPR
jgi:polyhydroxybutyrate depolymerase